MALHVFVIKEAELEDPQDLRAEIGKCPISTNERKNMSTKTLRKRIALVAVAALGAGVLVTSPASAAAPDNNAVGAASISSTANVLNIATAPSTSGDAETNTTAASNKSRGLLANSTTQTTSSLTSTATVSSSSEVVWYTTSGAATDAGDPIVTFVVDGATITEDASAATTKVYSQDLTTYSVGTEDTGGQITAIGVTPKSGVTSYTVSMYTTLSTEDAMTSSTATNVAPATIISGAQSKGTLVQRYVVTVASASASGVYADTYSYVQVQENTDSAVAAPTTNVDETGAATIANSASSVGYVSFSLKDAYNVSLSGKGALVVTATNGAGIALYDASGGYGVASSVTNLTAVSNFATGTITVARPAALANKGFSTTVTISWNGAVVGTKTIKFQGEVAKITVSADYVAQNGTTSAGVGSVSYVDDAGNTLLPSSGTSAVSSTLNSVVTGVSGFTAPTVLYPYSDYDVSCGGSAVTGLGAGSANVVFQFVNPVSGSIVKSAATKISCSGNATTFSASFDKATYAPGDIATLTISGKDAAGNAANAFDNWLGSGSTLFSITTPTNLTIVTAISSTSVKFTSGEGTKTYKYIVGTTEGTFNAVVSAGVISANNVSAGGAGVANAAVKYSVAATSTAVSMADVLKAIVSLIASINKQIAALQKALLKK
jgi:hypothetical protein